MKNDFLDDIIKDKLNQQQYEFSPADWSSFEAKQSQATQDGSSGSNLKWFIGGAAAIVIIAISTYIWQDSQSNSANPDVTQEEEHKAIVSSNEIAENNNSLNPIEEPENNEIITTSDQTQNSNKESYVEIDVNDLKEEPTNNSDNQNYSTEKDPDNNNNSISENTSNKVFENEIKEEVEIIVPSAVIMSSNLEVCPGESISLETIEQSDVIYAWSLGDGTYSNNRSLEHVYSKSGKYIVSLIVTSSKDRSILSKSKEVVIEVLETPNTSFTIEYLDDNIMPSIQLVSADILPSYYWEFSDGTTSTEANPVKTFKKKGYYNVTLSSTNFEGCTSKTTEKVTIKEDYNLLAPNSFTPNGDGINDYFIPEALKAMDVEFTMTIYSQGEGLIFESKNINQQWDGRNQQNGQNCEEDTYIWVVSLVNSEGKSEQYKGAVLLLK